MGDFQIVVASDQCEQYCPDNAYNTFKLKLPIKLRLDIYAYAIKLESISCTTRNTRDQPLYVLCDLCQGSFIGRKHVSLLKYIPIPRRKGFQAVTCATPTWIPAKQIMTDTIWIKLLDSEGKPPTFIDDTKPVTCVINFKRLW